MNMTTEESFMQSIEAMMPKGLDDIRLVILDAGILISLAKSDLLHIFLEFGNIVTTDIVEFEVTRKADYFNAKKIADFFAENKDRVRVEPTGYEDTLKFAKANPDMKLPRDLSDSSHYGFINDIIREVPGIPTVVLLTDEWLSKHELGSVLTMVRFVSTASFLKYAGNA